MISNRKKSDDQQTLGNDEGPLSFWTTENATAIDDLSMWTERSSDDFKKALTLEVRRFPSIDDPDQQEKQKHLGIFVHGFNNSWNEAARRYRGIADQLYNGADGLGLCVLFTWPSDGSALGYVPDRIDARRSADDLADVLSELYDVSLKQQRAAADNPKKACRAKISLIAHSMGNFVTQKALKVAWTRNNQPLLVSLLNQLVMVAADVDNDLFASGESIDKSDGDAISNLTYRVTALYSGRDATLGVSAGLKHFGKRRLGRSGLDTSKPLPDNVWDIDCSHLAPADIFSTHSSYFENTVTMELMKQILAGTDRTIIRKWVKERVGGA